MRRDLERRREYLREYALRHREQARESQRASYRRHAEVNKARSRRNNYRYRAEAKGDRFATLCVRMGRTKALGYLYARWYVELTRAIVAVGKSIACAARATLSAEFRRARQKERELSEEVREGKRIARQIHTHVKPEIAAKHNPKWHRAVEQSDGTVTAEALRALLDSATTCCYCGSSFNANNRATFDHYVPLVRGGAHSLGNIRIACLACNNSKSARLPSEWKFPAPLLAFSASR